MCQKCVSNGPNYVKVEDHNSLMKDTKSSAIISTDHASYEAALLRKKGAKRFQQMENDISELKSLVTTLIQKLDK